MEMMQVPETPAEIAEAKAKAMKTAKIRKPNVDGGRRRRCGAALTGMTAADRNRALRSDEPDPDILRGVGFRLRGSKNPLLHAAGVLIFASLPAQPGDDEDMPF
jgi:hypothetical protein